jgi:hypothetical protein
LFHTRNLRPGRALASGKGLDFGRAEHDSLHRRKRSSKRDPLPERSGTGRRLSES